MKVTAIKQLENKKFKDNEQMFVSLRNSKELISGFVPRTATLLIMRYHSRNNSDLLREQRFVENKQKIEDIQCHSNNTI